MLSGACLANPGDWPGALWDLQRGGESHIATVHQSTVATFGLRWRLDRRIRRLRHIEPGERAVHFLSRAEVDPENETGGEDGALPLESADSIGAGHQPD